MRYQPSTSARGRLLRLVPVAAHHVRAADDDLADLARRGRGAVGAAHRDVDADAGCPHERARGASSRRSSWGSERGDRRRSPSRRRGGPARRRGTRRGRGAASRWRSASRRGRCAAGCVTSRGRASCSSLIAASIVGTTSVAVIAVRVDEVERLGRIEGAEHDLAAARSTPSPARRPIPAAWNSGAMISQRVSGVNGEQAWKCMALATRLRVGEHHALRRAGRAARVEEPGQVVLADRAVVQLRRRSAAASNAS